jgi:signal transduction histidine kinase
MLLAENGAGGRRIGVRIFALVGFGLLVPLLVSVWGAGRLLGELRARTRAECRAVALLVAERTARAVGAELESLESAATAEGLTRASVDLAAMRSALHEILVRRYLVFQAVFWVEADGRVAFHDPATVPVGDGQALLERAARLGRPAFTDLVEEAERRRVYALVPVADRRGRLAGLAGGVIALDGDGLRAVLELAGVRGDRTIDIVDGHGVVVASTDPGRRFRPVARGEVELARAPLAIGRWTVVVTQPRAAWLAAVGTLAVRLVGASALVAALALVLAWGAAASVTRPLGRLGAAAERLARGELDAPIPTLGSDEVGRLAAAFENVRVALKASLERVSRANALLEERVRERTLALERANRDLKEREEARRRALGKVIAAQEAERKRIARELHDETSQTLAALAMTLDATHELVADAEVRRRVDEAQALSVRALDGVHRLILDLRPSVLDDLGLQSAIEWYAERCLRARGIAVRCEFSGLEGRLPVELEAAVFRIAQEAMTNIARHAHAETVLVQCARHGGRLAVEIEDDGAGFVVAEQVPSERGGRGFGLLGMRERAELLGGTVVIESAPGAGTRVVLDVPIGEGEAS